MNMAKSRVFFSPNVDEETCDSLCNILGFRSTPNLGKYLGFPIQHKNSSSRDFDFILERVHNKLQGWKAKLLSMVGRLTLTKAVLSAIPSYTMQGCILSSRILANLDKVRRNFLWGSTDEKKKLHMVGWSKVTKQKNRGGLGLHAARERNTTLAAKLYWRMKEENGELKSKVLKFKYKRRTISSKAPKSRSWKAVLHGAAACEVGSKWSLGNNSQLSFWDCKVEFNQLSCWLSSMPNLLVI